MWGYHQQYLTNLDNAYKYQLIQNVRSTTKDDRTIHQFHAYLMDFWSLLVLMELVPFGTTSPYYMEVLAYRRETS